LIVGLIGAFIGDWLLPRLGIHLGTGIVALIVSAFIGAVVLLLILRLVAWIMADQSRSQLTLSASALAIVTGPKMGCRIPRRS
jgi:hypothetical protein